jgi:methylmalonyl-CoA carboxyltransferase small subunit
MHIVLRHKQQHLAVDLQFDGGTYRASVDGTEYIVVVEQCGEATLSLAIDGRRYRVDLAREDRNRLVAVEGEVYTFAPESDGAAHSVANVAQPEIVAPMPGKVLQVAVQVGEHVAAGDTLLILEAMKMETRLTAETAASVVEVRVAAGDMVDGGQVLVVLSYEIEDSAPA